MSYTIMLQDDLTEVASMAWLCDAVSWTAWSSWWSDGAWQTQHGGLRQAPTRCVCLLMNGNGCQCPYSAVLGCCACMLQWRKGKGKGEKRKKGAQRFRGGDSARLRFLNMAPLMPMLQETETVKEIVVIRNPPAAHVYNVVEHGRR